MRIAHESADIVATGGGTAGHVAPIQAARAGARISQVEKTGSTLGGSMTDGFVFKPDHWHASNRAVVKGIGWELFRHSKEIEGVSIKPLSQRYAVDRPGCFSNINVPIYATVAEQATLDAGVILHYHEKDTSIPTASFRALVPCGGWRITVAGRNPFRRSSFAGGHSCSRYRGADSRTRCCRTLIKIMNIRGIQQTVI